MVKNGKKIIGITGNVWTGLNSTPWRLLEQKGFQSARWFTTYRRLAGDKYRFISPEKYHILLANDEVLAHMSFGSYNLGIRTDDFKRAMKSTRVGVLVVGFEEIIRQVAEKFSQIIVFLLKDFSMQEPPSSYGPGMEGKVHRINLDSESTSEWSKCFVVMENILDPSIGTQNINTVDKVNPRDKTSPDLTTSSLSYAYHAA